MNKIIILIAIVGIVLGTLYFFTTTKGEVSEEPQPTASLSEKGDEKEAIIAAIMSRQELFASGDMPKIRAYFSKYQSPKPDEYAIVQSLSDTALKEHVDLLVLGNVTEAELRAEASKWEIAGTEAKITLQPEVSGSRTMTTIVTAYKVGDTWY